MCLDAPAVLFVGCVLKFKGKKQLVRVGSLTFIPFVFILQGALKIEKNVLERNTYWFLDHLVHLGSPFNWTYNENTFYIESVGIEATNLSFLLVFLKG